MSPGTRGPRRVAVTSPQTRVALAGRRGAGPPVPLDRVSLATAERIRRRQLRIAAGTLAGAALLLVGLPVVLDLLSVDVRIGPFPVAWIAVAVLPYPVLAVLARVQLRRAERAEQPTAHDAPGVAADMPERHIRWSEGVDSRETAG